MQFNPKSEKEIREGQLWPAGEYDFEILEQAFLAGREWQTCETRSQSSGKDMIQLVVRIVRGAQSRVVIDYLMAETPGKLRHAADACGLIAEYDMGELSSADFIGSRGRLRLRIERDRSGQYPDKNAVGDYVPGSFVPSAQARLPAAE